MNTSKERTRDEILVLENGRILDVENERFIERGVIIVRDKLISDIGSRGEVETPKNVEAIDLKGNVVLPGLIDAHMHLTGMRTGDLVKEPLLTPYEVFVARAIKDLEALLDAGFTTIGDAGSVIALNLKQAVEEGTIIGPRIIASGYPLSQTFGHGDEHYLPVEWVDARTTKKLTPMMSLLCDGVDECRKAARYALRQGADFIKVMATGGVLSQRDRPEYIQFSKEELRAIVEEAEHANRFVHAHAQGSKGIIHAIEAGVKVIAHAIYIDDEGCELAKQRNVVVVPTLSVVEHILRYGEKIGIPPWGIEKSKEVYEEHISNIRRAYRRGVKLATGTDFMGGREAFRHGDNALEIKLLIEKIGMRPIDALKSATLYAAEAVGLSSLTGSLRKDKYADLIVIKGNPLDDPDLLLKRENILMIMKEGRIYKNIIEKH